MTRSAWKAEPAGPRSVAILGPYGCGKSTLFDALLTSAGVAPKRQNARAMSTELRLGHCTFMGEPWALVDCPGSVEFAYETAAALTAVDFAIIVCDPSADRLANLPVLLKAVEEAALPHLIFINKIDTLAGQVREIVAALQPYSSHPLVLRADPHPRT